MIATPFKLALIQMKVEGGAKHVNLERAETRIAEAARAGADIVLLPECLDLGWTHPSATSEAEPIPGGEPCSRLATVANAHSVFVCAGITERCGNEVFNAAIFVDPAGEVLHVHRKINELDIGREFYSRGDRLGVVRTDLATFGVMICADGFARGEVISRTLCEMRADVILSPGAWAVPADHDQAAEPYGDVWRNAYIPVAREFGVWIAGVSNVGPMTAGPWEGRHCIGCSLVIGPGGVEVAQGPYGIGAEEILYLELGIRKSLDASQA